MVLPGVSCDLVRGHATTPRVSCDLVKGHETSSGVSCDLVQVLHGLLRGAATRSAV